VRSICVTRPSWNDELDDAEAEALDLFKHEGDPVGRLVK